MRARPNRLVLTQKAVEKLPVLKKRAHYYDKDIRGFGVRVEAKPSGRKSFFFFVKADGEPEFKSLGQFPDVTVSEARTAAKLWAGKLSNWKLLGYEGPSPFAKEKRTNAPSFQQLIDAYIERHVKEHANRPEHAERSLRWTVKKYFGDWLSRPIDSIRIEDVVELKNRMGKKRYLANRLVEHVRAIYNWSQKRPDGKINFWPLENPARDVELYPEAERDRFLQPIELVRFHEYLEKEPAGDLKDFLILALATAARKQNVLGMTWAEIQWERENWHITLSKSGEYNVRLTIAALDVLKRRRSEIPDCELYVFPSRSKSGHVIDIKKKWEVFRKNAGLADVTLHDLRRTAISYAAMAGANEAQIMGLAGHRSRESAKPYVHLLQDSVAEARAKGERKMLEMMAAVKKRTRKQNLLTAVSRG
jgi:integrase